jgi:HK97 family phage major capsid protein
MEWQTKQTRTATIESTTADDRTVRLAFASETPVERGWGTEILEISPAAIRAERLNGGSVPLLMDHDMTRQIGIVEGWEIGDDKVARATVRFGRSALASEILTDVQDGIRRNISVGYQIHDIKPDGQTMRATAWEPVEISIVSVPADASVGIGRAADLQDVSTTPVQTPTVSLSRSITMSENLQNEIREAELARVREILAQGDKFAYAGGKELAQECVRAGKSLDEFRSAMMERLGKASPAPTAEIGLSDRETAKFSIVRAIQAMSTGNWKEAGFEQEVSRAVAKKLGRDPQGIYIPYEALKRDLTVGTATAGGHTVATDLAADSFIEMLRNRMAVMAMGARSLTGLVGNVAIPRQTSGATSYWVAESGAPTEGAQAFDQVSLTPKTVGAFTDISRKLLLQSSIDVESFVRTDLAASLALAIDLAALNGSGASNQPTGIINTSGVGAVDLTSGISWADVVELESDVGAANADVGSLGYMTTAALRGTMKTTLKSAGVSGYLWEGDNTINGYKAMVSNQVPAGKIVYGNWNDLIVGMWGALDITTDIYTGSTSGTVRVVALQDVDVAVRHAASFSVGA